MGHPLRQPLDVNKDRFWVIQSPCCFNQSAGAHGGHLTSSAWSQHSFLSLWLSSYLALTLELSTCDQITWDGCWRNKERGTRVSGDFHNAWPQLFVEAISKDFWVKRSKVKDPFRNKLFTSNSILENPCHLRIRFLGASPSDQRQQTQNA